MTRTYTLAFYVRVVRLYRRMPAKRVARIMNCAESTVRSARHRLKMQRIATCQTRKSGLNLTA